MGISGLLPFLENASRKCYINEFRGCTVAVDSYCWLHKGAFACADKLVRGESTNVHIMYCLKYVQLLLDYNIKPIMVFDGQHLPAKKDTESKRREQRKTAHTRGLELLRLGKTEEARQCFRQCVNITHDMALTLIKECRKLNVDCIVAPYEADAQLAYLNLQGIAQIVITEDSDLVLFGCTKILFKFSLDGSGTLVEQEKLYLAMKMRPDEYTFDKFRYMCIMSGCDYLDSLPGVGLKRAHKAVVMTHDPNIYNLLARLPRYLNLRKLTVSQEYIENFKLADATIRHQIVFDPIKRELVRLTDLESTGISPEYLKNAGQMFDRDKAFQMALGNIDPINLQIKDDWNPDVALSGTNYSNSIWSEGYTKLKSPRKTSNRPNVSAESTKNQKVTMSTANMLAMKEQQMLEYDNKLAEELKVYQTMEPPSKRQKISAEIDDDAWQFKLNTETVESELKVETYNPFIKNIQPKRLSKFGRTTLESKEFVTSPFFASKSKDSISCTSETEENEKCDDGVNTSGQKMQENDAESSGEGEASNNTYSESTICSNEDDGQFSSCEQNDLINNETEPGSINLRSFAFKELPKRTYSGINRLLPSINKKVDSLNFSDQEEDESESLPSDKLRDGVSSFSTNEDFVTPTGSQSLSESTQFCSQKSNEAENANEDNSDGRTSPVLSVFLSPGVKKYNHNKRDSSLETFKYNSFKKKIFSSILKKHSVNMSDEELSSEKVIDNSSICSGKAVYKNDKGGDGSRESDIENLTPEESFTEVVKQPSTDTMLFHSEKCRDATALLTCTGYNLESAANLYKEENTSDIEVTVIDEPKLSQEMKTTMSLKGTFKRSNSCRSVGLSRNKKKVVNQPTILTMFNKMTSKD